MIVDVVGRKQTRPPGARSLAVCAARDDMYLLPAPLRQRLRQVLDQIIRMLQPN